MSIASIVFEFSFFVAYLLIGILLFIAIWMVLKLFIRPVVVQSRSKKLKSPIIRLLPHSAKQEKRQQLLHACGVQVDVQTYYIVKGMLFLIAAIIALCGIGLIRFYDVSILVPYTMFLSSILLAVLLLFDHTILLAIRRKRSLKVMAEVYVLCKQLLYYKGSSLNLHTKLQKCIPFTRTIRTDLYLLTNEWYEDAELAISRFQQRLGTIEGQSFAETLHALHLYNHDLYYDLLRQRISDYKEKIEMIKESRKEATSYILFVLAGLPILNTFRIFIYPWVSEGQRLFNSI